MKTLALPPGPRFGSALDPVTLIVILLTMIGHAQDLTDCSLCSTYLCWWELDGWCFVSEILQTKCNSSKDGFLLVDVELGVVCVFYSIFLSLQMPLCHYTFLQRNIEKVDNFFIKNITTYK